MPRDDSGKESGESLQLRSTPGRASHPCPGKGKPSANSAANPTRGTKYQNDRVIVHVLIKLQYFDKLSKISRRVNCMFKFSGRIKLFVCYLSMFCESTFEMSIGHHSIQSVARRTGLTPHVIRIWEKRYAAVQPSRTETNRRLYSDA